MNLGSLIDLTSLGLEAADPKALSILAKLEGGCQEPGLLQLGECFKKHVFFFFFVVLGFELGAYTLSHSPSPICL
jgi:hypothetical protein